MNSFSLSLVSKFFIMFEEFFEKQKINKGANAERMMFCKHISSVDHFDSEKNLLTKIIGWMWIDDQPLTLVGSGFKKNG